MEFTLRKAVKEDIDLLIEYKLKSILDYADDIDDNETKKIYNYVMKTVPEQLNDYKIIEKENKTIGCFLLEFIEEGYLLNEIYLEENYRNQGIGSFLIKQILKRDMPVSLWVYKSNPALNLYLKLGFKIIDTTETRYFMKYN